MGGSGSVAKDLAWKPEGCRIKSQPGRKSVHSSSRALSRCPWARHQPPNSSGCAEASGAVALEPLHKCRMGSRVCVFGPARSCHNDNKAVLRATGVTKNEQKTLYSLSVQKTLFWLMKITGLWLHSAPKHNTHFCSTRRVTMKHLPIICLLYSCCPAALYGLLFSRDKEAAFANYRMWESLGFVIAFAYSTFICLEYKLYIMLAVLLLTIFTYPVVEFYEYKHPTLPVGEGNYRHQKKDANTDEKSFICQTQM